MSTSLYPWPPPVGVTKYMAQVDGAWASFRVFETGQPGVYLFDQLDQHGCSTGMQFPMRAADLRPDLRRALRHGWGLTTADGAARMAQERADAEVIWA